MPDDAHRASTTEFLPWLLACVGFGLLVVAAPAGKVVDRLLDKPRRPKLPPPMRRLSPGSCAGGGE